MKSRRTRIELTMNGTDISRALEPFLQSLTYEDKLSGETDSLEIELDNSDGRFLKEWAPELGTIIRGRLVRENWSGEGVAELDLGAFEVDEMEVSEPSAEVKIKGVSVSQESGLRQKDESRSWENVRLSELAREVAQSSGVELWYDAPDDPLLARVEQGEASRLSFLEKICADNGLILRVADGKLIICEKRKLEAGEVAMKLRRGVDTVHRLRGRLTIEEVYKAAEVVYSHGQQDEVLTGRFDSGAARGKELRINRKVESREGAERLARQRLREANEKGAELELEIPGELRLVSGNVIEMEGYGVLDGRWLIESARHSIGRGYMVRAKLHKCLGY